MSKLIYPGVPYRRGVDLSCHCRRGREVAEDRGQSHRLFVEVVNPKGQPVLISTAPFQPAAGVTTYQNITLPQGEQPIGDPPEEIRKIAFPDD